MSIDNSLPKLIVLDKDISEKRCGFCIIIVNLEEENEIKRDKEN